MPLDKLILILVIVIVASGATVSLASLVLSATQVGGLTWMVFIPAALVGYIIWRVISDRVNSAEDDHYDNIEK